MRLVLLLMSLTACSASPAPAPAGRAEPARAATARASEGPRPGERFPDVGLHGAAHAPFVVVTGSTRCSCVKKRFPALRAAEADVAARGVAFLWLYPDRRDVPEVVREFHRANGLAGEVVIDGADGIARRLGVAKAGETFVVDADGVLRYRGAFDVQAPRGRLPVFADALDAVLDGRPVATAATDVAGCSYPR